ncbi:MAG TPA: hypothetical protein VMS31_09130, partial [Pyrinomonadaceae bacterium]|nr:hypothetical protein [Pyrinomonadaceae bacterium]
MKGQLPVLSVNPLPPLYGAWMNQLLAGPIPSETKATCDDCAMAAAPGTQPSPTARFFDPVLKCCTYMPTLPNFLVGRILSDFDLPAKAAMGMQSRLQTSGTVTPLGVTMSPTYS